MKYLFFKIRLAALILGLGNLDAFMALLVVYF